VSPPPFVTTGSVVTLPPCCATPNNGPQKPKIFRDDSPKAADTTDDGDQTTNKGPNPGGSRGGPKHRAKVAERAQELADEGWDIIAGGGGAERTIPTPNGHKPNRRPDITARNPQTGEIYNENIGRSLKTGEPVARERRALDDIEGATGQRPGYTPYDR
jgi:hypothetical protein